jgi:hypothetical protein
MIGFGARTLLACVLVLAGSACLCAQTTSGSIIGAVTDATGAAISQASVTVTNLDTGIASKFIADATGSYVATPLSIGRYSVAVESKGFKKTLVPVVTVDVLDRVRVDLQLRVGDAATESVDVHAGASLLESETSDLGQLVDSKRIVDLPHASGSADRRHRPDTKRGSGCGNRGLQRQRSAPLRERLYSRRSRQQQPLAGSFEPI